VTRRSIDASNSRDWGSADRCLGLVPLNEFPARQSKLPMNRGRSIAFSILGVVLLAGCVYDPLYFEDPLSPPPYFQRVPPYPPPPPPRYRAVEPYPSPPRTRYSYPTYRQEPYLYRRQYFYDERDYGPDLRPSDRPKSEEDTPKVSPPSISSQKRQDSAADTENVPMASKGSKPGRVKVPFPPYNELDVSGLSPGSLAKDPTTGKVFRLPY
jgi:hypothetical protein